VCKKSIKNSQPFVKKCQVPQGVGFDSNCIYGISSLLWNISQQLFSKDSVLIVREYSDEYAKWTKKQFTVHYSLCVSTGYEMKA